jgi:cell volume regulation protein A
VYVAGLLVADEWAHQDGRQHAVPEAFAAAGEAILFAALGAAFASVATGEHLWQGVVIALLLALAVRPLVAAPLLVGSGLDHRERVLVSWGGLKGAVPLLLAGYPALDALDGSLTVQGVVLAATAASLVVQGSTLGAVARWATRGPDEIRPLHPRYDQG